MSRLGLAEYYQWIYPKKTNAKCTNNCGTVGSFNDIMSKMLVGLLKRADKSNPLGWPMQNQEPHTKL